MSSTEIHMAITRTAKDIADTMDAQILAFFGSEEQARAYAHLFVIEQQPVHIETGVHHPLGVHYTIETEIRIRPKTLKELEAEGLG